MKTVAIIKEVNETELVATWTPHDIEVKVGDWLEIKSEWQGLTDGEIRKAFKANHCDDLEDAFMCGVQFAEVMLKEKNYVL